ncbi:MAG: hypothetical protein ACYC9L_16510 [Sulfuricaulis sp.]
MTTGMDAWSNSDTIATAAVIIAFISFLAAAFQACLSFQSSRLSVKPLISIETCSDGLKSHLTLHNLGIGPAIIRQVKVTYSGETYDLLKTASFKTLIAAIPRESKYKTPVQMVFLQLDSPIPAGSREILLRFDDGATADNEETLSAFFTALEVFVSYDSLYGTNFHADNYIA